MYKTKVNPNFNDQVLPWWCLADVQQALFGGTFGTGAPATASIATRQVIDAGLMAMNKDNIPPMNAITVMYFEDINNSGIGGHIAISVGDGTVMTSWNDNSWHRLEVNDFIGLVESTFAGQMQYMGWSRYAPNKSGKLVEVAEEVKNEEQTLKAGDYAKLNGNALFDWNHIDFDKSEPTKAVITVGETGLDESTGYRWIKPMLSREKYFMHDFNKIEL